MSETVAETRPEQPPVTADESASSTPAPAPAPEVAQTPVQTPESSTKPEEPTVTPANASRGGRETSDRILYVGNLDLAVTEEMLKQYFQVGGAIANVKILMDKNNKQANYAFVEFHQPHDANVAFQTLDGKQIENT